MTEESTFGCVRFFEQHFVFSVEQLDADTPIERFDAYAERRIILCGFRLQLKYLLVVGHTIYVRHGSTVHMQFILLALCEVGE